MIPWDMAAKLPAPFTPRLLAAADWKAAAAASSVPLHELRQVHSHSQGVPVSPLADQALRALVTPSPNRLRALRTALRVVATPGLQATAGPYGELGLLMLVAHMEIWSTKQDQVLNLRQDLVRRLDAHGLSVPQAWDAAWVSLETHRATPFSPGRGTHLSLDKTLNQWAHGTSSTWVMPAPPVEDQSRMVDAHLAWLSNWVVESGWRLDWLVAHADPHRVAQDLQAQVSEAWAIEQASPDRQAFQVARADDSLATGLTRLSQALDRWVDLDWSVEGLSSVLPRCLARHRERSTPLPLVVPVSRRRFRA